MPVVGNAGVVTLLVVNVVEGLVVVDTVDVLDVVCLVGAVCFAALSLVTVMLLGLAIWI